MTNAILVIIVIILAVIGLLVRFSKALKTLTEGTSGVVISLLLCILFGEIIRNHPIILEQITQANNFFTREIKLFSIVPIVSIVFYIALFLVFQIIRLIIIWLVKKIERSRNRFIKSVDSLLGMIFITGVMFLLCLVFLAFLKYNYKYSVAASVVDNIKDCYLIKLYEKNPIIF